MPGGEKPTRVREADDRLLHGHSPSVCMLLFLIQDDQRPKSKEGDDASIYSSMLRY